MNSHATRACSGNSGSHGERSCPRGEENPDFETCEEAGAASGRAFVALDSVGAGTGEMVYYVRGKEASFPFLPDEVPADATIVGIVDSCDGKKVEV